MDYKELYNKYAPESYQNSFDHGFWEGGETRSKGEMVMLIISELGECQEANRKDHKFVPDKYNSDYTEWCFENYRSHHDNPNYEFRFAIPNPAAMSDDQLFSLWFENNVKNTEQDEMADVAIRIMDFIYGWRCQFKEGHVFNLAYGFDENFSAGLLGLASVIITAYDSCNVQDFGWGYTLCALCRFCEKWDIDLEAHIALKQRYNRSRPFKHSKKY